MSFAERNRSIFTSILACVEKHGLFNITILDIAKHNNCSESLVKIHFSGIFHIRQCALEYARKNNISEILDTPIVDMIEE